VGNTMYQLEKSHRITATRQTDQDCTSFAYVEAYQISKKTIVSRHGD
jgi:hypothetical protein